MTNMLYSLLAPNSVEAHQCLICHYSKHVVNDTLNVRLLAAIGVDFYVEILVVLRDKKKEVL